MAKPKSRKHKDQTKSFDTQLPMFTPNSDWRPPNIGDFPEWPSDPKARVGIDVETCDPELKRLGCGARRANTRMVGFSFRIEGGYGAYVPLSHGGGDNVENPGAALAYLAAQARSFKGEIVGCNLGYDADFLAEDGVDFIEGPCTWRDIGVAEPLLDELQLNYSMQAIAGRYGHTGKDEALLRDAAEHFNVHPKAGLHKLPARFVGPYGLGDVDTPLDILRRQEALIEQAGLWDIFNLECRVQPILTLLRRRGVRIHQDRLQKVKTWSLREEKEALDEVERHTGYRIGTGNVWQASAVAPALEAIGVKLKKTSKGQPEIQSDMLKRLDHPVADKILWARKVNKLRTTFAASVEEHMVNGRLHATFNQLRRNDPDDDEEAPVEDGSGARYGRLSSEKPNLQQQPARDEFAKMWREIYLPEEDSVWAALDYSQQEPRMMINYAEAAQLSRKANTAAFAAAEAYRTDPTTDNHDMVAQMAGIPRARAKTIFLGKIYGMGGAKLCRDLGLPTRWCVYGASYKDNRHFDLGDHAEAKAYAQETAGRLYEAAGEEGQTIINTFDNKLPFVRELAKFAEKIADERGYVRTLLGRHCHFPVAGNGSYDWTNKALNRLIQGSAADQTKLALCLVHERGHFIQLQVHDELDGSFSGEGDSRDAAELMKHCTPQMTVPSKVDVELGESWGDSMKKQRTFSV